MTIMEAVNDTPANDKTEISTDKVQDENVPINDNGDFHNNSRESNNDSINKPLDDKKSDVQSNLIDDTSNKMETNDDEDLEDGEIDDDDEEEVPKEPVDAKSDIAKHKSNENSDHSDANLNRSRADEESDPSDNGKKHGSNDTHKSKDKKSRRDKRSDRDLKKELQDDEAKKREIKEKIRELERQMKIDDEGEDEEDLEEMGILGVGGSPRENRKQRKRKSDSDSNNENEQDRGERSRSRSPKRRKRDRDDRDRRRRGRDPDDNKRGGFGSGGFGSGFGRNGGRGDKTSELCKLFMQGKCPKSQQNCLYSHNAEPPKIMELCKFYLLERCAKREKCLYLHKGFPCKYFHTGHRCMDDAESCKFSHENLTEVTRTILLKHLEAAPKEILGDFPRLTREKALELVYKTEAKNKGWETDDKSKEEPQPKSAGDSFVEQQNMNQPNNRNDNHGFGPDERSHGPLRSVPDETPKRSRWEADSTQRDFEGPFMQNHPPPLMQPPPNFSRPPGPGPRGPFGGPFGPRGPIGMGFGPRGPNPGLGLLGQAPGVGNRPPPVMGENFSQNTLNQRDNPVPGNNPFGNVPPGYGDPGFGDDQVKTFLQAQRKVQNNSGVEPFTNSSSISNRGPPPTDWNGPIIPAGPNSTSDHSKPGKSPERERTPTPEDNMDFGEDSTTKSRKNDTTEEKSISQRKVYEELQRKHKEKEMRLESVKEPNPMFKEDNWYSSEEESEEKSDRSNSDELSKAPGNLKRKSPEKSTSSEDYTDHNNAQTSQNQIVKTTILSLRETPATPPPPPTLSASDRTNMEASSAANNRVTLPKELTQVLSSIQTNSSSSFESNTSPSTGKRDPRTSRDPRQQSKNDPRLGRPSNPCSSDSLSDTEREREKEKRILEMDLSIFGDLDLPTFKDSEDNSTGNESPATEEENALGLPFKPHKVHQVAKEIDASIYSHSPLEYRLRAILIAKPDYSDMLIKQHIPASKVQQDPRLRRYSDKISGKLSAQINTQSNDRRYSDDGIEIMSPPGPTKAKGDPRRNKSQLIQNPTDQANNQKEEENVYNPIKDLYQSRPQQSSQYPQVQQSDNYSQEVYSPTQDVQDMYSSKAKKQNDTSFQDTGVYNPRQDLNPNSKNSSNHGLTSNMNTMGPTGPWNGGPTGNQYNPYENFYGGNNQDYSGEDRSFYNNHQNNFGGISSRGGVAGNGQGVGMISGAPSRNGDPRTNRRDPRRKD